MKNRIKKEGMGPSQKVSVTQRAAIYARTASRTSGALSYPVEDSRRYCETQGEVVNKNKKTPVHPKPLWSLYVLECEDGSFYTGISPDPVGRLAAHRRGKGAAYTRMHKPRALRVMETVGSYPEALRREWQVKKLSKAAKRRFIANPSALPPPMAEPASRIKKPRARGPV